MLPGTGRDQGEGRRHGARLLDGVYPGIRRLRLESVRAELRPDGRRRLRRLHYMKCLLQIAQQVADVLHSTAQTDQAFSDSKLEAAVWRDAGMGHRRGVADQALDAAE